MDRREVVDVLTRQGPSKVTINDLKLHPVHLKRIDSRGKCSYGQRTAAGKLRVVSGTEGVQGVSKGLRHDRRRSKGPG
jgi:hypothetical protein